MREKSEAEQHQENSRRDSSRGRIVYSRLGGRQEANIKYGSGRVEKGWQES